MTSAGCAYLDHAATTPMRAEAVQAMLPFFSERFGNPSGGHAMARDARKALEEARDAVAACLGCQPKEVVFTAGGTEADNLALRGVLERRGGIAVCPAAEHHAVLHPVEHGRGRVVAVGSTGVVELDALAAALDDTVRVVSVMLANNEVGAISDLGAVAALLRERAPQAVLHTDAVQAYAWLDVSTLCASAQLVSISAHKFGGPKGVGALVVRDGVELEPLLLGGGQEQERRSGTQNVAGIVAMARAMVLAHAERVATVERTVALRARLVDGLMKEIDRTFETVPRDAKVAGSAHVCFEGVQSEELLYLLERDGVYASAASSCASGAMEPSHVLHAMGVPRDRALGAVRFSLGPASIDADIDHALEVVPRVVGFLRR